MQSSALAKLRRARGEARAFGWDKPPRLSLLLSGVASNSITLQPELFAHKGDGLLRLYCLLWRSELRSGCAPAAPAVRGGAIPTPSRSPSHHGYSAACSAAAARVGRRGCPRGRAWRPFDARWRGIPSTDLNAVQHTRASAVPRSRIRGSRPLERSPTHARQRDTPIARARLCERKPIQGECRECPPDTPPCMGFLRFAE